MEKIHTFVVLAYKESNYLEECIKSVLNQKYKSKVIIATSTDNEYIRKIAEKYNLQVKVNSGRKGIGRDFDFAIECAETDLVTIAHQDDIYDFTYSDEIVKKFNKYKDIQIIFTDYYEMKKEGKVKSNLNLFIKRVLLLPIRIIKKSKFIKRLILRFGCSICCPAVTFNTKKVKTPLFECVFKCNVDWNAWETLSKEEGRFIFVPKKIMGHRVHEESTTTEIIKDNIRTKEDLIMLERFWPEKLAKFINRIYVNSEKSNEK